MTPRLVSLVCLTVVACATTIARAQDTDACINASEKAVALHKAEKLINARASLSVCAASSCPDLVRSSCRQRLAQVNQSIPSIVFVAKDGAGHDLAALTLIIDGAAYADHLDGNAVALDPGEHEFRFEARGQSPVVKRFVLHNGEQNRREDIVVGPASTAVAPSAPWARATPTNPSPPREARSTRGDAQRTIGLGVGAVGAASVIAGAIFGGLSLAAHGSYERDCGSNVGAPRGFCTSQGVSGESEAATKGTLSTLFFVAGGVAATAGAIVFLTAPRANATPQVGIGLATVVMGGRF
jgi:hypothetical protein